MKPDMNPGLNLHILTMKVLHYLLVASAVEARNYYNQRTIAGIVWAQPEIYSTLDHVLEETGLNTFLDCPEYCYHYTLFCPNDAAFARFPLRQWLDNDQYNEHLKQLVLYHLISGRQYANKFEDGSRYDTLLQGESLLVSVSRDSVIALNTNNTVIKYNKWARNGLLQGVDDVLLPPCAKETVLDVVGKSASMFFAALAETGMDSILRDNDRSLTVLAPMDSAFGDGSMLNDINSMERFIKYHIIPGMVLKDSDFHDDFEFTTLSGTNAVLGIDDLVTANVLGSNGVVHFIDRILTPPKDLVQTASSIGMTSFVHALEVSNLTGTFDEGGPYTMFGWSNNAWANLEGADALLLDPGRLRNLIMYHVVPGCLLFEDLHEGNYTTMLKDDLKVKFDFVQSAGGSYRVLVNDAITSDTNLLAANGCLHVISKVLYIPAD